MGLLVIHLSWAAILIEEPDAHCWIVLGQQRIRARQGGIAGGNEHSVQAIGAVAALIGGDAEGKFFDDQILCGKLRLQYLEVEGLWRNA